MPSIAGLAQQSPLRAGRSALIELLVRILRPLVLLMLKQGMTAYEFSEIARWVFAHTAMDRDNFAVSGRDVWSMTKSRAAVLTGLTRREVDRLVQMRQPAVEEARRTYHRSARILAAWQSEPGFQDPRGRRIDLPVKGAQGSLEWLVRHYCRDIPVRAMLDELEDRGCVERVHHDRIRFISEDLEGPPLPAEAVNALSAQAENFCTLVEHRLDGELPLPQFVEVAIGPVGMDHRETLQRKINDTINSFVGQLNRELSAHPKSLIADARSRLVVGVYNGFI